MWLKCQGPGLYSLLRLRRQWPACTMELQIMANSDWSIFEKKRNKSGVLFPYGRWLLE